MPEDDDRARVRKADLEILGWVMVVLLSVWVLAIVGFLFWATIFPPEP